MKKFIVSFVMACGATQDVEIQAEDFIVAMYRAKLLFDVHSSYDIENCDSVTARIVG